MHIHNTRRRRVAAFDGLVLVNDPGRVLGEGIFRYDLDITRLNQIFERLWRLLLIENIVKSRCVAQQALS